MKKQFVILGILFFSFLGLNTWAQDSGFRDVPFHARNSQSFGNDFRLISASLGFINVSGNIGYYSENIIHPVGPLLLQYEHALTTSIGIAPFVSYSSNYENKKNIMVLLQKIIVKLLMALE